MIADREKRPTEDFLFWFLGWLVGEGVHLESCNLTALDFCFQIDLTFLFLLVSFFWHRYSMRTYHLSVTLMQTWVSAFFLIGISVHSRHNPRFSCVLSHSLFAFSLLPSVPITVFSHFFVSLFFKSPFCAFLSLPSFPSLPFLRP
jgi:hypothetical protein